MFKLSYDYKGYNCFQVFNSFDELKKEYKKLKKQFIRFNGLRLPLYENFKMNNIK